MAAAFVEWLKDRGGYVNPKINIFHKTGSDAERGVYAEQNITEGEQLLLVPVPSTLHLDVEDITSPGSNVPATCSAAVSQFLQAQQPPFSPFIATTVMLMAELALGDASPFAPYFATLPEATDCLLNWSEEERRLLAGTSLHSQGRSIQEIYECDIAPKLRAAPPGLFPAGAIGYEAFRRAADMVQTRAFHMKADNWLTGASQESTDELYLIPAIDMLNHSSRPALRNTSLALFRSEAEVTLGDGQKRRFKDFFSMKAERDIPAGCQVLHTYGHLGDAQLLQTYGFLDAPPALSGAAAAASAATAKGSKSKPKAATGSAASAAGAEAASAEAGNPHNYVLLPLAVLLDAVKLVAAAAHLWPAKKAKKLLSSKLTMLAAAGLLQQQQPQDSQLMLTAAAPLPDELLTIVQVLLMTEEEFQQLQQAEQEQQLQQQDDQQQQQRQLNLGHDLLQGEFGELVGTVLLQAVGSCLKQFPRDTAASAAAMSAAPAGSRPWMAAAVALGEQLLLQQLKKAAIMLMVEATQGGDNDEDSEAEEDEEEDEEEEEDEDEDSEEEEHEPPPKKARAGKQAAGKQLKKKHQAVAAAAEEEEGGGAGQHKHGKHKHHHHKQHHKKRSKQQGAGQKGSQEKAGRGKRDGRPHYGNMTGPLEQDVWLSDDSENVVGYSESEDDSGSGRPAAAAAAAAAAAQAGGTSTGKSSGRCRGSGSIKRQRHPADPSERHTYEVAAGGAVREVHGHMVGPEEAELIESDDSDKVGYVDDDVQPAAAEQQAQGEGQAAAAAAAAAAGCTRSKRSGGGAAAAGGGSKRPKKGLGFKG